MFYRTPGILPLLYPHLLWRVQSDKPVIYLTFDDGPVPGPTEFVLDTLREAGNIPATFFCIGDNVRKHPAIFQRVLADGHAVGNHTEHHVNGWRTSTEKYRSEVAACDARLPLTRLFRPPYGRISRAQISAMPDRTIVMWDVLTHDYNKRITPDQCLKGAISATRPGSIIVFHDSLKAERNMKYALPLFLRHCLDQGFQFGKLDRVG